jgi:phosphotransferase system HPr (HPr) family protein
VSASSETAQTVTAEVVLPAHLHARPAGLLVQAAARFAASVEISYADRTASAKGILGVMSLGALAGSTVVVRATGPDAADATAAVVTVLETAE